MGIPQNEELFNNVIKANREAAEAAQASKKQENKNPAKFKRNNEDEEIEEEIKAIRDKLNSKLKNVKEISQL